MPTKLEHKKPLISVLMGVYYRRNDLYLLRRSIESILSQTYSRFELLICDDGSTDAAKKEIDCYAEKDLRIRLIRRGNLTSLSEKLNACLELSQGSLIARMDDDDFSAPDRFEKQVSYLMKHLDVSFVGSNVRLWRNGEVIGTRQLPEQPEVQNFLLVQPFIHPSLMFHREALRAVGGYLEDKYCFKCEDYDLLLRLYEHGYRGENMQECLLDYTIPSTAKGGRTMSNRWNESVTRYRRFRSLGLLPNAWPYVVKPLAVGLLPEQTLAWLKGRRCSGGGH